MQRYEKNLYICILLTSDLFFMKKYLLLSVILFSTLFVKGQETYTFLVRDTLEMKLDVYQPEHPRKDGACVVYLFGGGFVMGERNNDFSVKCCKMLAERGFVAVAIDYRLYLKHAPHVSLLKAHTLFDTAIRQAVEDCSAALAWLCRNASELKIDTSHIVLTGSSAGAITVLQTDYCRANSLPPASSLPQGFKPAAVIPYAGGLYCGASQLKYVVPPAPTCFFHGTKDRIVNYNSFRGSLNKALFGANRVVKIFEKKGYNHWILRFDGRGHEIAAALPQTIDEFCAFVDATLSGRVMQYDSHCTDTNIRLTEWSNMSLLDLYKGL